jgi:hypothetical protein
MPYLSVRIAAICAVMGAMFTIDAKAGGITLACDNGRSYELKAYAVSADGDLVTGYMLQNGHRALHMRLIPMELGYRYAGAGVWLDGFRGDAVLNFGARRATACSVTVI